MTKGEAAEVRTWQQLQPLLVYMVSSFDSMAWFLYAAVFVAMAFGIANVLLMAVHERTREIGMLRAMGMQRRQVIALVVLESLMVVAVGMALGTGVALGGVWWLQDGIDLSGYSEGLESVGASARLAPVLRARDLVAPSILAAGIGVLASLWPAVRAARHLPADALRQT